MAYRAFVSLSDEEREKFEYICKEEHRSKTDMIKYFINTHYKELEKRKAKEARELKEIKDSKELLE